MPLQNRVDPFGDIHAVEQRGMFTGNRGAIHDPETKTLLKRRWTTKAWIICTCEYKGMRREPMGRNARTGGAGWTELFFLDEVTAIAAGHRPCFLCRREKAKEFLHCYGQASALPAARAPEMDVRLHRERLATGGKAPEIDRSELERLPDGAMVAVERTAYAVRGGKAFAWSFAGYGAAVDLKRFVGAGVRLITPRTTSEVLRAGYKPVWHSSAGA